MVSSPDYTTTELIGALTPVSEYHTGRVPTANSVLAAWLRGFGVSPSGEAWHVAKKELTEAQFLGLGALAAFRSAAKTAAVQTRAKDVESTPRRASGISTSEATPRRASASPRSWLRGVAESEPAEVSRRVDHERRPTAEVSTVLGDASDPGGPLQRFSKRFSPGDMDGSGSKALLGRPALEQVAILVRETAQNSWDARMSALVKFELRLRRATPDMRRVLRDVVFADSGSRDSIRLSEILEDEEIWLLEISDRGTRGLEGPTRNDLETARGVRTDYADFVLTLGAPRDKELGGGTYGFGKTISYTSTDSSTVVIWTRCRVSGGYQDRLVASAFGEGYSEAGIKYTGRHWWGRVVQDRVEPVLGSWARSVGDTLYSKGFEADETGTSLLLVAPHFGETEDQLGVRARTPREYAQALSDAAMSNLWPKLVGDDGRDSMEIKVFFEDEDLSPGRVDDDPVLGAFATSLRIVRSLQAGSETFVGALSEHWDIVDGRGRGKLLGHCAATRYLMTPESSDRLETLFPSDEAPEGKHLCLMRHDAELVVRYREGRASAQKEYGWAAVFKPVAAFDDAFADAEPPSHDDWLPQSVKDPKHKSPVNISLNQTKKKLDEWASPRLRFGSKTDEKIGAAALAEALGGLMGGSSGGTPVNEAGGRNRRATPPKKRHVKIQSATQSPHRTEGFVEWSVVVRAEAAAPIHVKVRPAIATAAGPEHNPHLCQVEGWYASDGREISNGDVAQLGPGEDFTILIKAPVGLALDVKLQEV